MAIFSNLEGTMKKTFILGKNGARFETDGSEVEVQNYHGTSFLPVAGGKPVKPDHFITLQYYNENGGSGGSSSLSGRDVPENTLGVNGNTYYQVDDTKIVNIFFKDQDIWKPFGITPPVTDSDYVTSYTAMPQDFIQGSGKYTYGIPASVHNRGTNLLVQVQDPTGNEVLTEVVVDVTGNIFVSTTDIPQTFLVVKLIGETTMTTPYSAAVNKIDWISNGSMYNLTIPATVHQQEVGPLYLAIYENQIDGASSAAPFTLVSTDSAIDASGNVTYTSYVPFSGKVVISGK